MIHAKLRYVAVAADCVVQTASLLVRRHIIKLLSLLFFLFKKKLLNVNALNLLLSLQLDDRLWWGVLLLGLAWCIIAGVCYGALWAFIKPSCLRRFFAIIVDLSEEELILLTEREALTASFIVETRRCRTLTRARVQARTSPSRLHPHSCHKISNWSSGNPLYSRHNSELTKGKATIGREEGRAEWRKGRRTQRTTCFSVSASMTPSKLTGLTLHHKVSQGTSHVMATHHRETLVTSCWLNLSSRWNLKVSLQVLHKKCVHTERHFQRQHNTIPHQSQKWTSSLTPPIQHTIFTLLPPGRRYSSITCKTSLFRTAPIHKLVATWICTKHFTVYFISWTPSLWPFPLQTTCFLCTQCPFSLPSGSLSGYIVLSLTCETCEHTKEHSCLLYCWNGYNKPKPKPSFSPAD